MLAKTQQKRNALIVDPLKLMQAWMSFNCRVLE